MNDSADLSFSRLDDARYDFCETKYDWKRDGMFRSSFMENSMTSTFRLRINSISSNITTSEPPLRKENLFANNTFRARRPDPSGRSRLQDGTSLSGPSLERATETATSPVRSNEGSVIAAVLVWRSKQPALQGGHQRLQNGVRSGGARLISSQLQPSAG
jgi:hypothetical protein